MMIKKPSFIISFAMVLLGLAMYMADVDAAGTTERPSSDKPVIALQMKGAIGPALSDYLKKGIEKAANENASLILIELDTPGGLLTTTREMTQSIISSPVPVAVYVTPAGAHAASAGTFILYAAHVAAMAEGTNVGAATPIQMQGSTGRLAEVKEVKEDKETKNSKDPKQEKNDSDKLTLDKLRKLVQDPNKESIKKKAIEDTSAFIKGLAELRGRNKEWAIEAVTEASSITAREALEKNVINALSNTRADLLDQIDGMTVKMSGETTQIIRTKNAPVIEFAPDWKTRLLILITDPNLAMILMSIGVYGLILEFYNPGSMVPGVIGAISLTLGLYAMNILPINAAGAVLCLLGVLFMMAEFFIPSFGIMGFGGFIAFIGGLTIMFETSSMPGLSIDLGVIWGIGLLGAFVVALIVWLAVSAQRRKPSTGLESMIGEQAQVVKWSDDKGKIFIQGETWTAKPVESDFSPKSGDMVRIESINNLTIHIGPAQSKK